MKYFQSTAKYIYLLIAAFVSIFPFYWMIVGSTNSSMNVTLGKLTFGGQLLHNFNSLLQNTSLMQIIINSFIIAIAVTLLSLIFSSMAGYAFDIYKTKLTNLIFGILLISMMVPFVAIMIPLFQLMTSAGLLNSFIAVILPLMATPFLIFFFRQNTQSFQKELIEAARIDGLSELQIFIRIYIPSMKASYAAAAIITFMGAWNNYLWPLVMLQTNDKYTLPLVISTLSSSYTPDYGMIMVAIIIATLPMLIIFFALQKQFVKGMVGAVK